MELQARVLESSPRSSRFRAKLLSIMDRKDHTSYWTLMGPGATRKQLFLHYQQEWGVFVRDFPIFLSRVHARCPVGEIRQELAENLYEEETGRISGGGPHGELFLHMMEGLGFERRRFEGVDLLPESRAYRRFLDEATSRAPWIVGLAVTTIFVEGSRNDRREIGEKRPAGTSRSSSEASSGKRTPAAPRQRPRRAQVDETPASGDHVVDPLERDPLVVNHGLDPRFLELKRVHRLVEGGHRLSAWSAVLGHARSAEDRSKVSASLEKALSLWLSYRDGVARAAKL